MSLGKLDRYRGYLAELKHQGRPFVYGRVGVANTRMPWKLHIGLHALRPGDAVTDLQMYWKPCATLFTPPLRAAQQQCC